MRMIYCLAEGKSDALFLKRVVVPWFQSRGRSFVPTIINTSAGHKGGHCNDWRKIEIDIRNLLRPKKCLVTTMLDLYAFPANIPGAVALPQASPSDKARHVENLMSAVISDQRFVPGIVVHEFEGLLFSDPDKIAAIAASDGERASKVLRLHAVRSGVATPEHINDGRKTAPSKRLESIFPDWKKTIHGPAIAESIGLDRIRAECPNFNQWVEKLVAS